MAIFNSCISHYQRVYFIGYAEDALAELDTSKADENLSWKILPRWTPTTRVNNLWIQTFPFFNKIYLVYSRPIDPIPWLLFFHVPEENCTSPLAPGPLRVTSIVETPGLGPGFPVPVEIVPFCLGAQRWQGSLPVEIPCVACDAGMVLLSVVMVAVVSCWSRFN